MREVSHELIDKLIHYDPACAMAATASVASMIAIDAEAPMKRRSGVAVEDKLVRMQLIPLFEKDPASVRDRGVNA